MIRNWTWMIIPILLAGCNGTQSEPKNASGKEDPSKSQEGSSAAGAVTELKIEDTKLGTGAPVVEGDMIFVRYRGTLADGTEFDSNMGKGRDLFSFVAGPTGSVIEGWQKGVIGMKKGGERKLSIPYRMAYGEQGQGKIPPKADLFFTIQLGRIQKSGEENTVTRKVLKPGSGPAVKVGSKVTMKFVGKVLDGDLLEDSKFTFTVGKGEVIPGIDAGIQGMKKGGQVRLIIPANAAFGPLGKEPFVPAGASLDYTITILDVK
jgi:peptidylprolyl isomerase